DKYLSAGIYELVVEMCEKGGGEAFKVRYEGPDTGGSKVTVPASALKHEHKRLAEGLECDYFYDQAQCYVPDLGGLTPSHSAVLPNIYMHSGKFPHVIQDNNFCIRCSGYLSTQNAGNYKFYTASDDGSLLYLNGEKVVDNNGCHSERERSSQQKFLGPGIHHLVVDMCEKGGGERLKMRYEGPDTGNSKVAIPPSALKHEVKPFYADGLDCDYFYGKAQCDVPDLAFLTPKHSAILPNINIGGNFPHVRRSWNFCMRCSGFVTTSSSGDYKFYTASDDGSLLYLDGEKVVDNNGCHGERERSSENMFLAAGSHHVVLEMCEKSGGQALKMRYRGPDTGGSKVTVPASVLKHEVLRASDGLECDYFYGKAECDVPDLGGLTAAHTAILPNINIGGNFPHVHRSWNFCMRCSGYVSTKKSGNYRFYTASDDGSLLYLNGEKVVDNNGCHGERERSSHRRYLTQGLHHLVVDMCEKSGGQAFKMRYEGPDTGNSKKIIPMSALKHQAKRPLTEGLECDYFYGKAQCDVPDLKVVEMCEKSGGQAFKMRYEGPDTGNSKVVIPRYALKHEAKDFADGLECDYFYGKAQCDVPDLAVLTPKHSAILPNINIGGNFPHVRQSWNFCMRCSGFVTTFSSGDYKFYTASDDGSLLYLDGEKVVDNNGCHGEREKSSESMFLAAGSHHVVLEMCEKSGGQALKMRYEGPDTGGSKVTVPASVLKHAK
ncbi:rsgI3, partial [Symbiodinium microadriaticum]